MSWMVLPFFFEMSSYLVPRQSRSGIYLLHRRHSFGMNPFVLISFVEPKKAFDEGKWFFFFLIYLSDMRK
jgi:hypothetical protein